MMVWRRVCVSAEESHDGAATRACERGGGREGQ